MTDSEHLALVCSTAGDGDAGVYAYAYDGAAGTLSETASTSVEHPMYLAPIPTATGSTSRTGRTEAR
ncbi:hypothetical protein ACFQL4_17875 [Halosimplex aquaticum]